MYYQWMGLIKHSLLLVGTPLHLREMIHAYEGVRFHLICKGQTTNENSEWYVLYSGPRYQQLGHHHFGWLQSLFPNHIRNFLGFYRSINDSQGQYIALELTVSSWNINRLSRLSVTTQTQRCQVPWVQPVQSVRSSPSLCFEIRKPWQLQTWKTIPAKFSSGNNVKHSLLGVSRKSQQICSTRIGTSFSRQIPSLGFSSPICWLPFHDGPQ